MKGQTTHTTKSKLKRKTASGVRFVIHANTASWLMTALSSLGYIRS